MSWGGLLRRVTISPTEPELVEIGLALPGNFTKPVRRFDEWRFPSKHWPSLEYRSRRTVLLVLANSLPVYSRQTREVAHVYHSPCRLKIHEPPAACVTVVSNFSSNYEVREYGCRCSRGIFLSQKPGILVGGNERTVGRDWCCSDRFSNCLFGYVRLLFKTDCFCFKVSSFLD